MKKSNMTKSFERKASLGSKTPAPSAGLRAPSMSAGMPAYAKGGDVHVGPGLVRGPGGPRDDQVNAKLSNKEYVLPGDVVQKVGKENLDELLEKYHNPHIDRDGDGELGETGAADRVMNSLRHFADGGLTSVDGTNAAGEKTRTITNVAGVAAYGAPAAPTGPTSSTYIPPSPQPQYQPQPQYRPQPQYQPQPQYRAPQPAPVDPAVAERAKVRSDLFGLRDGGVMHYADGGAPQSTYDTLANRGRTIDNAVNGAPAPVAPAALPPAAPLAPAAPTGSYDPAFLAKNGLGPNGQPLPKPSLFDRAKSAIGLADGGDTYDGITQYGTRPMRGLRSPASRGMTHPGFAEGGGTGGLLDKARTMVGNAANRVGNAILPGAEGASTLNGSGAGATVAEAPLRYELPPQQSAAPAAARPTTSIGVAPAAVEAAPAVKPAFAAGRAAGRFVRGATGPAGLAAAATIGSAADSFDRPTDDYYRRLGMDSNDRSFVKDNVVRGVGVLSDAGAGILDLGTGALNAALRAGGASKQLSSFGDILRQQDTPNAKPVGAYQEAPPASAAAASAPAPATGASGGPSGPADPSGYGNTPSPAPRPLPGQPGGGLRVVDGVNGAGERTRTITGDSGRSNEEIQNDPYVQGSRADRLIQARGRANDTRSGESPLRAQADDNTFAGFFENLKNRRQGNFNRVEDEKRRAAMASDATTREGQQLSYGANIYGHQLNARTAANTARLSQMNADRTYGLDKDKFTQSKQEAALRDKEASEKNLQGRLEGMYTTADPKTGAPVVDRAAVAEHTRAVNDLIGNQISKLESVPRGHPQYEAAQAQAERLRTHGASLVPDDVLNRTRAQLDLKKRSQEAHSGINPFGGTHRDSNDPADYEITGVRKGFFQDRAVTRNGSEIPVKDIRYQDGPGNVFGINPGRITTNKFDPAKSKGLRSE